MSNIPYFSFKDSEIKLVTIEVIKDSDVKKDKIDASDIIEGKFAGFSIKACEEGNDIATLLTLKVGATFQSLNLDTHGVMSLEVFHSRFKEEIYFQKKNSDQIIAKEMILELIEKLDKAGMMKTGCEDVDIDKYKDTADTLPVKQTANTYNQRHNSTYSHNHNTTHKTYLTAKEKADRTKPTVIKKVSDVPDKAMLATMRENVIKLSTGDYEQPAFEKIVDKNGKEVEDWEGEAYSGYSGMCY